MAGQKKRILYYDWDSLMQKDMLLTLQQAGHEVIRTRQRAVNYLQDERFMEHLTRLIRKFRPDFCFSFNFFPVISEVCRREEVCYVAWIFDSPALTSFHRSVYNSCNRIFHFDRGACERLAQAGVKNIYHLPLAARPGKTTELLKQDAMLPYHDGITMVGRIYDKKNMFDQIRHLPERLTGYLEGVMEAQKKVWGYNFLEECLDVKQMEKIGRYVKLECPEDCFYTPALVFANLFLGQKLTAIEREEALLCLSRSFTVRLYSDSVPERLAKQTNFRYAGTADSDSETPLVFHSSRINLNLTLRSILTGIPLRVFDIAEAGGFILTNYQQELPECFEPDREIVIYGSIEELEEKARYYLAHEQERQEIAEAGARRLCTEHTLEQRLEQLLAVL